MVRQLQPDPYSALHSEEKGDLLHSVQRALLVLSLFADHPQGLSARDISKLLQVNISTCYHILNTLVANGYLERHPDKQEYVLGPQIPFLNNAFVQALSSQDATSELEMQARRITPTSMVGRLRPILYRLTEQTQEPSYMAAWQHGEVVLQAIVEAPQAPKITRLYVGHRGQTHSHALGKVLLAYSDPAFVDRYLDTHPLTPFGPNTIVQRAQFIEELNDIVRQGYSIDREELLPDICCIAAPVFASQGQVVIALSISCSPEALTKRTDWFITQVVRAANHARAELRLTPLPR